MRDNSKSLSEFDFVSFKPQWQPAVRVCLRRQSFVVPLADTTQQIFQLRSDFGSANENCDAVVDAADDTDAICASANACT